MLAFATFSSHSENYLNMPLTTDSFTLIFTDCIVGKDNVFTGVCHSVREGGVAGCVV